MMETEATFCQYCGDLLRNKKCNCDNKKANEICFDEYSGEPKKRKMK